MMISKEGFRGENVVKILKPVASITIDELRGCSLRFLMDDQLNVPMETMIMMAGFDLPLKAMRTQKVEVSDKHLANSRAVFLKLVEKVRTFPKDIEQQCLADRDYETLEMAVLEHLMGG